MKKKIDKALAPSPPYFIPFPLPLSSATRYPFQTSACNTTQPDRTNVTANGQRTIEIYLFKRVVNLQNFRQSSRTGLANVVT
jgi:hypothetical protein